MSCLEVVPQALPWQGGWPAAGHVGTRMDSFTAIQWTSGVPPRRVPVLFQAGKKDALSFSTHAADCSHRKQLLILQDQVFHFSRIWSALTGICAGDP